MLIRSGTPEFHRVVGAFTLIGLASFNLMYATQGLIPLIKDHFAISPQMAATTVSATTGTLAVAMLPMSILSERFGRGRVMIISMIATLLLAIAVPFAPTIESLLVIRALQGAAIAGVPAVAMAWLSDEVHPFDLTKIMGYYIAGTTVGGLLGRIIPTAALEFTSWQVALGIDIAFVAIMATSAIILLPNQENFTPKKLRVGNEVKVIASHLSNPGLLGCFALAFLLMGSFVSLYNYVGLRLIDTFGLAPSLAGLVFILYLVGTYSSARAGKLASRIGSTPTIFTGLGLMTTGFTLLYLPTLPTTIAGIGLMTGGFFIAHSLASSWVGRIATSNRGEASGMYLTAYYLGSSVLGTATGFVLDWGAWIWLCSVLLGLVGLTSIIAYLLREALPASR